MAEPRVEVEAIDRALLDGVHLFADEPERERVDLGIVPTFSDERPLLGLAGLIDWRASGRLSALVRSGFCTSALGEHVLLPGDRRLPVQRLVLVGLGQRDAFDDERAREVGGRMVKISRGLGARNVLIALPTSVARRSLVEATFEGMLAAIEQEIDAAQPLEAERDGGEPDGGDEDGGDEDGARETLGADPSEVHEARDAEDTPEASDAGGDLDTAPASQPEIDQVRWWIAADASVVARLRRVLSGPPRAARGGSGLHT